MRVLVAIAHVPFLRRATEALAEDLSAAVKRSGHRAEIVRIPFGWTTADQLLDHILATRLMDWTGTDASLGDVLIALEFPAYLIPHPRKILWLAHDRTCFGGESEPAMGGGGADLFDAARRARAEADRRYLPEMERRFAVSAGVAAGLRSRSGLDATTLYPPPRRPDDLAWRRQEGYLLVPPGVPPGRVELALQAVAASSSPLGVKHCGRLDESVERALRETAARLRVADRVEWLGELPEGTLAQLYGASFAVFFPAQDESLPSATLYAGLASKAIIVCSDSGAPAELVRHERNGAVVEPKATALAAAIDDLRAHPERAAVWGRAGRDMAATPTFGWPHVVGELLRPGVVGLAAGVGP